MLRLAAFTFLAALLSAVVLVTQPAECAVRCAATSHRN